MGTSLSGLTPATTFDGLLKTGDNDPIGSGLKTISDGSGNDTVLQLSDSALSIGGTLDLNFAGQTNVPMQFYGAGNQQHYIAGGNGLEIDYVTTKITENVRLAYAVSNRDVSIGESGSMGAKLGIKGSGATSATTSLLVQNSAGSDYLKVTDDGNVQLGSSISVQSTGISAYNSIQLKTFIGGGVYESGLVVTGNGAPSKVGIGETTPTARLHVKGSGNDNTTTSLLVQNSDGDEFLSIADNGLFVLGNSSQTEITNAANRLDLKGNTIRINPFGNTIAVASGTGIQVGNGTSSVEANTRFQIKGSGTDASTIALRVQNSAGTDTLIIGDDGFFKVRGGAGVSNLIRTNITNNNVGIGLATPDSASRMHIQGKGATSATAALLVENSAGTERLKVQDDGKIYFNGVNLVVEGKQIYNANTSNGFLKLNSNRLEYSDSSTSGLDNSAALTVTSTTRGFLPPRMTDAERDAITSPAAGLMIYDTSNNQMNYWNGSTWIAF